MKSMPVNLIIISIITTAFIACSPKIIATTPTFEPVATIESPLELEDEDEPKIIIDGGTADEYGCIPSAGYQWSEVRKECIRIWETGIKLESVVLDDNPGSGVYIICNADTSQMEVSLIGQTTILTRNKEKWAADGSDLSVSVEGFYFLLYKGDVLKYRSEKRAPQLLIEEE
jgi:hypothetical protein